MLVSRLDSAWKAKHPGREVSSLEMQADSDSDSEVPVFGLLSPGAGFIQQGGETIYYLDARDAEQQCLANPGLRVEGVALDSVYFDASTRLQPSRDAKFEATLMPAERCLGLPQGADFFLTSALAPPASMSKSDR